MPYIVIGTDRAFFHLARTTALSDLTARSRPQWIDLTRTGCSYRELSEDAKINNIIIRASRIPWTILRCPLCIDLLLMKYGKLRDLGRPALRRPSEFLFLRWPLTALPGFLLWLCNFSHLHTLLRFSCFSISSSDYSQAGSMHNPVSAISWSVYH